MGSVSEHRLRDYAYVNRVIEPGSLAAADWVQEHDIAEVAGAIRRRDAPPPVLEASHARWRSADPDDDLEVAQALGARLITPECDEWPHFGLSALYASFAARLVDHRAGHHEPRRGGEHTPPIALWLRGADSLAEAAVRHVAIVGARASTAYGEHVAADLARGLAERDVTVVSGGAFGIDACAHRGALAAGGRTWLVSAGGVERAYPARHEMIYERVMADGLVISEYPPGSPPLRHRFLMRNRLIAALSCATVVVEAALRSGALSTVRHAYTMHRPALAVPGPITSALSAGCHQQIRRDEEMPEHRATLVTSAGEIMAHVDGSAPPARRGSADAVRTALDALPPQTRQIFDGLPRRGWATEAQIAARCGASPFDVVRALPALDLAGLVESSAEGHRVARAFASASSRTAPAPVPEPEPDGG